MREVIQDEHHIMKQIVEEDVHAQLEYFEALLYALINLQINTRKVLITPSILNKNRYIL